MRTEGFADFPSAAVFLAVERVNRMRVLRDDASFLEALQGQVESGIGVGSLACRLGQFDRGDGAHTRCVAALPQQSLTFTAIHRIEILLHADLAVNKHSENLMFGPNAATDV